MDLNGKVALITGSGKGIGKGIALSLAEAGANVVIHEKNKCEQSNVDLCKKEIETLGRKVISVYGDVSNSQDVEKFVEQSISSMGRVDVLVNSAGINFKKEVEIMTDEEWDLIMKVNVKSIFLTSRAIIPHMKELGTGKIINISSTSGKNGHPYFAHYCASKFAVIGFSNSLAKELAKDNILVNVICPGYVWTPMWERLADEVAIEGETPLEAWKRIIESNIPLGRAQSLKEIGDMAVYLASSDNVTGQAINVDGGEEFH